MSSRYKFRDPNEIYFISYSVVGWIDLFIRTVYKDTLLESWRYCQKNKRLLLYAWCIMTSDVHMIIGSDKDKLENIIRDMKKFTSVELKNAIKNNAQESRKEWMLGLMTKAGKINPQNMDFQLWQQSNHPVPLTTMKIAHQKLDYIHNNPLEAGFVDKPEEYLYSSARDYFGMKGLIDVVLLDSLVV